MAFFTPDNAPTWGYSKGWVALCGHFYFMINCTTERHKPDMKRALKSATHEAARLPLADPFDPAYLNVLDQIDHAPVLAMRAARLQRLRSLIARLWPQGHPTKFVHVAGTSGKGSVCRFIEAGFALEGHAGSMTSPHVFDYRERISVNGRAVTPMELTSAWEDVVWPLVVAEAAAGGEQAVPPYGHLGLLLALVVFERRGVKWAALETGCGGRYDARMALDVQATVLTTVGDDHPHTLGYHLWQRAIEKAGIARPDTPFLTMVEEGIAAETVVKVCRHVGADLAVVGKGKIQAVDAEVMAALAGDMPQASLLQARHQRANLALALSVVTRLAPHVDRAEMIRRIAQMESVGRFQKIDEDLYIDGAHNPEKAAALAVELKERFPDRPLVLVLGLSGGRDGAEVLGPLLPVAKTLVATQPTYKGVAADLLAAGLKRVAPKGVDVYVEADAAEAIVKARKLARPMGGVVVATGSMYMLDEALNPNPYVKAHNGLYGWRFDRRARDEAGFLPTLFK